MDFQKPGSQNAETRLYFFVGTVKSFMKNGKTYGTTKVTEKHSASSKKQIKKQRQREVENRLVGKG